VSRSHGGKGIKENLFTACALCHHEADNGKNSKEITQKAREYLEKLYPEYKDEMRIYDKWRRE
jgi:cytochrome c553